eukprot:gb/GECG01010394.1/.p1 GENE.gb/GECG01010394.1/~~gb/GECG01010394.1/.p1  ORF type:complete len:103 (+),score=9.53 gb/GECG01010394.1/:1-309(+)
MTHRQTHLGKLGPLSVAYSDAAEELQDSIVQIARDTLHQFDKGELKTYSDVAHRISEEIGSRRGGTWHCIVGEKFGSFVTHETSTMTYFFISNIGFLIFKHG